MLKSLKINNIAIIENAEPVFSHGLNVMTGETGAGKSIIVDSINAILGERTSKGLIRSGCEKASVVAVFDSVSSECEAIFDKYDIEADNGEYVFQKTLSQSGKSSCRINGLPVNTSLLKEIGEHLINIHGQHDNQLLLDPENHILYLDAFAENKALLDDYNCSFQAFKRVRKELNSAISFEKEKSERIDILKYQIDEISQAKIKLGEVEELKEKQKRSENSEKISEALSKILSCFTSSDDSPLEAFRIARERLSKTSELLPEALPPFEKLTSAIYELEGVRAELQAALNSVEFNSEELNNIQNRLDNLYELMRKYGGTEQKVLDFLKSAEDELLSITLNSEAKQRLEGELYALQEELIKKADALTRSRSAASERLSKEICEVLKFLDMQDVRFEVKLEEGTYTALGKDRVEFLICANKGQRLMPLSKVASGGELSRIMLSIKSVLADKDSVDTLIFDEIDTGISGKAARKIGIQLKRVSKLRQVICITHLAQIAAIADNHMLIEKSSTADKTFTSVRSLEGEDRVLEVARIMSGAEITENLYKTAEELIRNEQAEE